MPSNLLLIDAGFPTFTGEESPQQQIRALHDYIFQLREGLQYSLRNLTTENFNATALQDMTDAQKNEVTEQLQKVYAMLNQMSAEIDSLSGRINGTENLSGRLTAAESEISNLKGRVKSAEEEIEGLAEWNAAAQDNIDELREHVSTAQSGIEDLGGRVKALEDDQTLENLQEAVTGEGGLQERIRIMENTVTGEDGVLEQTAAVQEELEKISGTVQVTEDGSATIGSAGAALHLVGQIYINGVLYE